MKEVILIRHGEKDETGDLTSRGKILAESLGSALPKFAKVVTSDSQRTIESAFLITGEKSEVDKRAGFYTATQNNSDAVNNIAKQRGITFFEAANIYNNGELMNDITAQAENLNKLIDEILTELDEDQVALIVSHDMTITPAMVLRGQSRQSIDYLSGFRIGDDNSITKFDVAQVVAR